MKFLNKFNLFEYLNRKYVSDTLEFQKAFHRLSSAVKGQALLFAAYFQQKTICRESRWKICFVQWRLFVSLVIPLGFIYYSVSIIALLCSTPLKTIIIHCRRLFATHPTVLCVFLTTRTHKTAYPR